MSGYNEQHATTMLNALQGTETLERFKQEIRAEVIEEVANEILNLPTEYIDNFDYVSVALILNKVEQLKEQK